MNESPKEISEGLAKLLGYREDTRDIPPRTDADVEKANQSDTKRIDALLNQKKNIDQQVDDLYQRIQNRTVAMHANNNQLANQQPSKVE